jgi:hypothetical protein
MDREKKTQKENPKNKTIQKKRFVPNPNWARPIKTGKNNKRIIDG